MLLIFHYNLQYGIMNITSFSISYPPVDSRHINIHYLAHAGYQIVYNIYIYFTHFDEYLIKGHP